MAEVSDESLVMRGKGERVKGEGHPRISQLSQIHKEKGARRLDGLRSFVV